MKKIITAAITSIMLIMTAAVAYADYNISVRMDRVTSEESQYVQFGDIKPVQLDSRTLVPARAMAEAAGMEVVWDQPTQTALLLMKIGLYSDKPIERYAAKAISMVDPPTPGLEPVDITAAIKLDSSTAIIRYNFRDSEGDYISVGCEYEMVSKTILIDDGTLMLPLRDSMEIFGLSVGWNQDEMCAYVSVPETVTVPNNLKVIQANGVGEFAPTAENLKEYTSYNYQDLMNGGDGLSYAYATSMITGTGRYLGKFRITHYCPCEICNGSWGGTAWAGAITPGQTIGVNPNVIAPLSWVHIEGYGLRRAEDTGSGIGINHIDIAVEDHETVRRLGTVYRDVYLVE